MISNKESSAGLNVNINRSDSANPVALPNREEYNEPGCEMGTDPIENGSGVLPVVIRCRMVSIPETGVYTGQHCPVAPFQPVNDPDSKSMLLGIDWACVKFIVKENFNMNRKRKMTAE